MKIATVTADLIHNDGQSSEIIIHATKVMSGVQIQFHPASTPMDADLIACAVKVARLIDPNYMK